MSVNIVRAWSDPEYRAGLTAGQLASVPANPVSVSELSDEELSRISGGVFRSHMSCFCELDHYSYALE